jgi:glutaredoxin 3
MATVDDPVAFAKSEIANNDIMVFSKSYCPYCDATKALFDRMDGANPKIIELDLVENGPAIQAALQEITGQRTVPNVFIKGTHIGGNDATQLAAKMGKIKKMLAQ